VAGAGGQVVLLAGLAACAFVVVALGSYHADDVSLSVAGTGKTDNLVGPIGAYAADALYQGFGYASWAVLLVGVWLALRLAGRAVGGWISSALAAVGFILLAAGLQLALARLVEPAFPPGGVVGLVVSNALAAHLGRVGAALAVGTGLMATATVLFRINWQPLAARAVDRVQQGAPLAVRGVGALGAGAVRASLRVGGAGLGALRDRLRGRDEEEDEEDEDGLEDDIAEGTGTGLVRVTGDGRPALPMAPEPAPLTRRAPEPVATPARAPGVVPRRAAVPPSEPVPELPSVWSARQAPPAPRVPVVTGDPERDAPTRVGGRSLVEVEWEPTGSVPAVPSASAPRARPTPIAPVVPVAPPVAPPVARRADAPPPVEWADVPEPMEWADAATSGRPSAPRSERSEPAGSRAGEGSDTGGSAAASGAPARAAVTPARESGPAPITYAPPPPAPTAAVTPAWAEDDPEVDDAPADADPFPVVTPPRPAPVERQAAPARRGRPSGDGVAVVPGNLKSGGAGDDGRAVRKTASPFQLPPLSLLDDHPPIVAGTDENVLHEMARRLTETLSEFDVDGRVTAIRPGPVITMFEYEPAAGVKLSRIAGLQDNLKMALKAVSVRIVAPLPGKGCVGIEIPNERRQTVWARDVFASPQFKGVERSLPMILGKDTEGRPFVTDLAKMPHLLVGGTTGSGKSVGVNSMLISMLFMRTPDELRMILIDPKMLEFALYEDIPHLLHPVVTEPKFASAVLKWACTEMDERYKIMARWQTRHIDTYNQKVDRESQDWTPERARQYAPKDWPEGDLVPAPRRFPYIVIVIDELADLMMVASSDVEASIARIVAKARAAGIHLIVATQTPRRDVITGMIKANMPASLAYQVRSGLDSRVILDQNGAESLLGKGDLLFLQPGTSDLVRIHGPYLTEDEVHRVADFLRAQGTPSYDLRIGASDLDEDGDEPAGEYDEKYDEAVEMAIQKGKISTSMLQRHLGIGYNRAANIVETMEREGVVGPADGARPREVLVGQG
jgi:S-DNA-T family DNA segregation ATPase FtsK/SpoIIIE